MNHLLIGLIIGLGAAVLDIIPMIIKKLDPLFILSAFTLWIVVGLLSMKVKLVPISVINGNVIALLVLLPSIFLIMKVDKEAIPQILITTLVLGAAVGYFSGILSH